MSIKGRSNVAQKCEDSVHGAANGVPKFDLHINNTENCRTAMSNDDQSTEGTSTAQSARGSVSHPCANQLKTPPFFDAVVSDAASHLRELVRQKFVEVKTALIAVEAIFDQFTEGEVIKALLQDPRLVKTSRDADDNEREYPADIGLQRLAWAKIEREPMLKEVKSRKPRVRTGRRRKSETGLLSGCPFD